MQPSWFERVLAWGHRVVNATGLRLRDVRDADGSVSLRCECGACWGYPAETLSGPGAAILDRQLDDAKCIDPDCAGIVRPWSLAQQRQLVAEKGQSGR